MKVFDATLEEMQEELPEILYKYRTWSDSNHKKVITEKQLFYSPPSWFEDPLDCKLTVLYDLLSSQEKIKWIEHKLKEDEPGKFRQYYRNKARETYKTSPLRDKNAIKKMQEETFKEYDERTGILSLTENPSSAEMWNKYSDNSKGFCVGFNPLVLFEVLGGGGIVHYVSELPVVKPEPIHSHKEQMVYQIFYKEDKWEFENEYRTHTFRPTPMNLNDRIINVPASAFNCIILGKNMSEEDKSDLKSCIPEDLKNIQIIEN